MLSKQLQTSQDAIRKRYASDFVWVNSTDVPWAQLAEPLSQSIFALVSTCGLYRGDTQLPFDAWSDLGDPSFREIHVGTPRDRLRIAHTHYDHAHVAADVNVALPINHFQALEAAGTIGALHPWTYSFMGFLPNPRQLVEETAPVVAQRLRSAGVDAAVLTPC
jgi:D-proline reductase (dithiol) PrdB